MWAAGVGLSVAAATLALRRWRDAPDCTGRLGWLRWSAAAVFTLAAAGLVGWFYR